MDKRMHLSDKMSMENSAANQESNGEMFVRRVASSGLVLKFKVDKYGTILSKHTISSQEVLMSGGKQNVGEPLDKMTGNGGNHEGVVLHTCNECGKSFKQISSLHGHTGIHRREQYKRMRMMAAMRASDALVSSPIPPETKKDEMKKIRFAARAQLKLSMKLKSHQPDDLSASMTSSNKHISEVEETEEMREVSEILATLTQSFRKDCTVHTSSSASAVDCFVCTTCKSTFSSYQGLGGHMSIHNNKPKKNSLLKDGAGAGSSSGGGGGDQSTWKHVCGKCNEKFSSGKSFGGHKRKHWWEEHKMALLLEDGNVKPPLPLASDAVQQPQEATSLCNEFELPMPSSVSDEDVA